MQLCGGPKGEDEEWMGGRQKHPALGDSALGNDAKEVKLLLRYENNTFPLSGIKLLLLH